MMMKVFTSVVLVVQIVVDVVCTGNDTFSLPRARPVGDLRFCEGDGQLCFSYDHQYIVGPPYWHNVCETRNCFFGKNQSPLWINPYEVQKMCGPKLHYADNSRIEGEMKNEGIYPTMGDFSRVPKLMNVPGFGNTAFLLEGFHIHFRGGPGSRGTEHKVWLNDYDAEMHLVHRREDVDKGDQNEVEAGRSVVAVFLSTREGEHSKDLDAILNKIGHILKYKLKLCRDFFDNNCPQLIYEEYFHAKQAEERAARARALRNYYRQSRYRGYGHGGDDGDDRDNGDNGDRRRRDTRPVYDYGYGYELGVKTDENRLDDCKEYFSQPLRCLDDGDGVFDVREVEICDSNKCPESNDDCVDDDCAVDIEFNPENLLPKRRDFYYYYGSLTSPPLSEVVAWQVMDEPIRITPKQLKMLQKMESREKGKKIVVNGNTRPHQAENGRKIYGNFCRQ